MSPLKHDVQISVYGLTDPGPKVRIEARCAWCGIRVANHTFVAGQDPPTQAENVGFMGLTAFDRHLETCTAYTKKRS